MTLRIGVYGGTFDPVHNLHLDIARAALKEAGLDRVLFVVAAVPPHKRHSTCAPAEDRFRMVELALAGEAQMEASRVELDRQGPSYTADTLDILEAAYPGAELRLIMGADSLVDLPKWKDPQRILSRVQVLALPRPGIRAVPPALEGHYRLLDFPPSEMSSTEVRRRIAAGDPLDRLVPRAVKDYILEKGLYDACVPDRSR